jgi:hypothetical protein
VLKKGSKKRHAATGRFVLLLEQGASKRRDMKLSRDLQRVCLGLQKTPEGKLLRQSSIGEDAGGASGGKKYRQLSGRGCGCESGCGNGWQ